MCSAFRCCDKVPAEVAMFYRCLVLLSFPIWELESIFSDFFAFPAARPYNNQVVKTFALRRAVGPEKFPLRNAKGRT